MRLHDLKPRPGAKHRRKRLGRGESSGLGKTSGKGHKGQKARSGSFAHAGFEGGQMPLYRRLPRRGFNNARFHKNWAVINVASLDEWFGAGDTVDEEALRKQGRVKGQKWAGIKILGQGELSKKLTVKVHKVSASAKEKIEAAGGTIELIEVAQAEEKPKKKEEAKKAAPKKKAEKAPAEKKEDEAKAEEPKEEKPKAKKKAAAKKEAKTADAPDFGADSHLPLEDPNEIPDGFPVKGNADSMLYHRPDSSAYGRTVAEVYFTTAEAAEKQGFKAVKTHPKTED